MGKSQSKPDLPVALSADVIAVIETQRAFFATGATKSITWRCEQIKALCTCLVEAAERLGAAEAADHVATPFGPGSCGMLMGAMGHYLANVGKWAAPKELDDTLPVEMRGGIECDWLRVMEPKGLVLNISPWNAPTLLSILPCLGALAAGNPCIIKPPDATPTVSHLLAELIAERMAPEAVAVVQGGAAVCEQLIDLDFDHIMFTGGTSIGRIVMARAAKTLTPVTLELGGKNPVFVDEMDDGMLAAVVKEIVGTKLYFAGEFCQCHDYFLVVDSMWDRFQFELGTQIEALGDKRMVRVIHQRQYDRVKRMLQNHSGKNHPSILAPDDAGLRLPMTAVIEPDEKDPIMQDEVFGPLWFVCKVNSIEEAMTRVKTMVTGKPLVSYYYGENATNSETWLTGTSSGSLAINAGPMRMQSNYNAAIHGVGNSGFGGASIWGETVFNTFSHAKHVVRPRGKAFAGSMWGSGPYVPAGKL